MPPSLDELKRMFPEAQCAVELHEKAISPLTWEAAKRAGLSHKDVVNIFLFGAKMFLEYGSVHWEGLVRPVLEVAGNERIELYKRAILEINHPQFAEYCALRIEETE